MCLGRTGAPFWPVTGQRRLPEAAGVEPHGMAGVEPDGMARKGLGSFRRAPSERGENRRGVAQGRRRLEVDCGRWGEAEGRPTAEEARNPARGRWDLVEKSCRSEEMLALCVSRGAASHRRWGKRWWCGYGRRCRSRGRKAEGGLHAAGQEQVTAGKDPRAFCAATGGRTWAEAFCFSRSMSAGWGARAQAKRRSGRGNLGLLGLGFRPASIL